MYNGKKITSYTLSPEAKGEREYVSNEIASYYRYNCSYCAEPFYIVHPTTHLSGGCIQRELMKHKDTGELLAVRRIKAICLKCYNDILAR